jgi:hypothetical protein
VKTTALIQAQAYKIVEMWECNFRNDIRRNNKLKTFCDSRKPPTPQRSVTESKHLEGVASGRLFGMVECDIRVPDKWASYFQHPTMTPYEYFEEMSPLFCTTDVSFDLICEHMQDHVWYLEHGMVVTKIYQVVEFTPDRCFQEFVKEVSDGRRLGDAHPDKAIIGDTKKGEGNSAYGGTIMDQEKFQSVTYVQGEGRVMLEVNKPQFKKMTTLLVQDEYFEVEKAKEKLDINLPIQIGYFILQYAKLRMLQFYYDYLDVYGDCAKHAKYDNRTPGLFKVEYEGDVMTGLYSKTYIVQKIKTVPTSNTRMATSTLQMCQETPGQTIRPSSTTGP